MRQAGLISLLSLVLSGCSFTALLPATPTVPPPPPSPTATIYVSPTDTPTITPTQPTATFTDTPTLIYEGGTPTASATPLATDTLLVFGTDTETSTATGIAPVLPLLGNGIFTRIAVSGSTLFWGSCEPSSVLATVHAADPAQVRDVLVFLRLSDAATGATTEWGGGAIMTSDQQGNFTYSLTAENFTHYREYGSAWGQFQFVALNAQKQRIGASGLYLNNLKIAPCP